MRLIPVCLLALTASTLGFAQETIQFGKRVAVAGDAFKYVQNKKQDVEMEMSVGGNSMGKMPSSNETAKTLELICLEADDQGATKVKLVCTKHYEKIVQPMMGEQEKNHKVEGKTLIVEKTADGVKVTTEDGEPVSPEVMADVEAELDIGIFNPNRKLGENLPTDGVTVGKTFDLPEEARGAFFANAEENGLKVEKSEMTLKEIKTIDDARYGVFTIAMKVKGSPPSGGAPMKVELEYEMEGEAVIAVDTSWVKSMKLGGPMKMNGSGQQGVEVKGDGKIAMDYTAEIKMK